MWFCALVKIMAWKKFSQKGGWGTHVQRPRFFSGRLFFQQEMENNEKMISGFTSICSLGYYRQLTLGEEEKGCSVSSLTEPLFPSSPSSKRDYYRCVIKLFPVHKQPSFLLSLTVPSIFLRFELINGKSPTVKLSPNHQSLVLMIKICLISLSIIDEIFQALFSFNFLRVSKQPKQNYSVLIKIYRKSDPFPLILRQIFCLYLKVFLKKKHNLAKLNRN